MHTHFYGTGRSCRFGLQLCLLLLLGSFLTLARVAPATAQSAANCSTDLRFGQAESCIPTTQNPAQYSINGEVITGGPFDSESEMNSFIQQWGAGFCSFNAESPPYAWSAPNVTSEAAIYYGTANYSGDYAGTGTSPLEFRRIYNSGLQFGQTWRTCDDAG